MRALLATALLAATVLAGCSGSSEAPAADVEAPRLLASAIEVPDGATLRKVAGGFALDWNGTQLPLSTTFTIPANATLVRAVSPDAPVYLLNEDTQRRRCNRETLEGFGVPAKPPYTCSSLALLDEPGATWRLTASGAGTGDVSVELLDTAPDGLLGLVDLSGLSKPTLELQETTVQMVPSFDGTPLRVEVTLPVGEGPWPAVIESSPYHDDGVRSEPASWAYFVNDWARRGYAVVVADVRGFGDSGGCVEVWGENEQRDQAFLVEWTSAQPWSNGRVGFYGQSYVGTTPVEAAVQAPEALKAIIAVAPVINAYDDWHHGGVPNGENLLSPVAYQALQDPAPSGQRTDPQTLANNAGNGLCDPTLAARANDPRALYDAFYAERDFGKRAGAVTAAVLYTQGFEDANVKSAMIPGWFNDLQSPKLGLFGHWLHQHPARLDGEALMVAWMDHYVKGVDLGLDALPKVAVRAGDGHERFADAWPPTDAQELTLWPHADGSLVATASPDERIGSVSLLPVTGLPVDVPAELSATGTLDATTGFAGVGRVHVKAIVQGAPNAYVGAYLYAGDALVTWGQYNVAHRAAPDHTAYDPVVPGSLVEFDLPFLPTEHVLDGSLRLVLRGVMPADATDAGGVLGARIEVMGGQGGTRLILPTVPLDAYHAPPLASQP